MKRLLTSAGFLFLAMLTNPGGAHATSPGEGLFGLPPIPRADFNRRAQHTGLPVLWEADTDGDGLPDPDEVRRLEVQPSQLDGPLARDGAFLPAFEQAYRAVADTIRMELVRRELDQGRPTVVHSDLRGLSEDERRFVAHIQSAARLTDELFLRQQGAAAFADEVARGDAASQTLFWRNSGPWCAAPLTAGEPLCSAVSSFPARQWDTWPPELPHDQALCERALAEGGPLLDPFHVVRLREGRLVAVPYTELYGDAMSNIAEALRGAAEALGGLGEEPLVRYLRLAAEAFETNQWEPADEAWAAMSARNSKWYLRVAPDEVYWDLCQQKAGFHLSFALIDERSVEWQDRLTPLRDPMERALAALIGKPYEERDVRFQMPDFVRIVLNAGNSRSPLGATAGQALPNWGKVAEEGRGRMMVVTNLYEDPDSREILRAKAASLLHPKAMRDHTEESLPGLLSVILHEATHNLGPTTDFLVKGKAPREIFGGGLASTMEELKAQTGALFFVEMLRHEGLVTEDQARQMYLHDILWAFGQISQGFLTETGGAKPYGQLAAVHVGRLAEAGALIWETQVDPDSGRESGRFLVHFERIPQAMQQLMREVGRIKATGDAKAARALVDRYVQGDGAELVHAAEIQERLRRFSKGTLVYSLAL